jgi:hypothetical protein
VLLCATAFVGSKLSGCEEKSCPQDHTEMEIPFSLNDGEKKLLSTDIGSVLISKY